MTDDGCIKKDVCFYYQLHYKKCKKGCGWIGKVTKPLVSSSQTLKQEVVDYVHDNPYSTINKVSSNVECYNGSVKRYLGQMVSDGTHTKLTYDEIPKRIVEKYHILKSANKKASVYFVETEQWKRDQNAE